MKYYSPTTKGFYIKEVHGDNMPSDVIEVSKADYDLLMEGQSNGLIIHYDGKKLVSILADSLLTDGELLAKAKQSKLVELEALCETQIISGFVSSALGSEHWYKSEQIDQLNLIGVVTGGTDDYFKSGIKDTQGVIAWDWVLHTSAQLKQVLNDGKNVKTTLLQKLTMQKAQVDLATTLAEVEAVVW